MMVRNNSGFFPLGLFLCEKFRSKRASSFSQKSKKKKSYWCHFLCFSFFCIWMFENPNNQINSLRVCPWPLLNDLFGAFTPPLSMRKQIEKRRLVPSFPASISRPDPSASTFIIECESRRDARQISAQVSVKGRLVNVWFNKICCSRWGITDEKTKNIRTLNLMNWWTTFNSIEKK